jgi:hypothetical protein
VNSHRGPPHESQGIQHCRASRANLCMSQSCLSAIVWELIAAPAPAGRSCILACDPRSSGILCQSDSGTTLDIERSSRKNCVNDDSVLQFFQPNCRVSSQVPGSCEGRIRSAASATTQLPSDDIRFSSSALSPICRIRMTRYIHDMVQQKCTLINTRQALKLFWLTCGPA